jgi:polygalacturonase
VLIDGCDIATGDDCISIKSGRGSEAYALLKTS